MKKQLSKVLAATLVISSVPAVVFADTTSEKLVGKDRFETSVKVSKSGWKTTDTVVLVNDSAIADALAITPLAEEKNAPILLTGKDSLNKLTKDEIKRLGAKNVILVGGNSVLSEKLEKDLKDLKLNIDRISGKNREETSLEILKRIDKINDISEIVVVNGTTGLADAVSIASIAAKNNMGIILANPKKGVKVFEEFIKNEDIKKSYIIGGDKAIPNKLIESLPSKERLSGANRIETNIRILEKFYSSKKLNAMYVAKDGMAKENQLVDALAIGVVAAKNDSPMIIVSNGLKDYQKKYINSKKIDKVVQVGGNGNENAFNEIVNLQKTEVYKAESIEELKEALNKADANDKIEINFDTDEDIIVDIDSSVEIKNNGNIGNIIIENSNADIINKGTIDKIEINNSKDTNIKNEYEGKIENIENNGTNTKVDNNGSIDKVTGDREPSIEGNRPGGSTGGGTTGGGSTEGGNTGGSEEEVEKSYEVNQEEFKKVIKETDKVNIKFVNKIPENTDELSNYKEIGIQGKEKEAISYTDENTLYIAANGKIKAPADLSGLFKNKYSLESIDISKLDTSEVTNMSWMFYECSSLTNIDLSKLDTSKVTNMSDMFTMCGKLTSIDLRGLDTNEVTNMSSMFYECSSLMSIDLSKLDTSKVTDMSRMFYNCSALQSINISNLDTSKVTDMSRMFYKCSSLMSINLSNLDTSKATDMSWMFSECSSLTSIDISNLDTSSVTNMSWMFYECSSLMSIDLSNLDTSSVINMSYMFFECNNLSGNITIMNKDSYIEGMFFNTATSPNSQFTINYINDCKDVVTKILNDNYTNGNVVEGKEVTFPPTTE